MKLTGSGFARAEVCPAATFLPFVVEAPREYARMGSAGHRFLCLVAEVGREAALELIEEEFREVCRAIDVDALPHATPDGWAFEVAYAWDSEADTARELYRGSGARQYGPLALSEVPGTADLIGLDGDQVIVLDLKFGYRPLGDPKTSLQLGFYAVAAARAYGATRALVGYVRLIDGTPVYQYATLDEFELEDMAARLKDVLAKAAEAEVHWQATGEVTPVTGDHCTFCPAFLRCPAKATMLTALAVQATSNDPALLSPVLDAENIPQVLERLWAVRAVLENVEKMLEEYAYANPVPLPDGRVYGPIEQSTESFDAVLGAPVLEALRGPEFAEQCVETKLTLTKAAIERALRKAKKPEEKMAHLERQVHAALRQAGAAKTSTYLVVKAFKPKRLQG